MSQAPTDELGGGLSGGAVSDAEWADTVKAVLPGIVKIDVNGCGFTATGTGFALKDWIITNRHVVDGAKSLSFTDSKGKKHNVATWRYSEYDDIAILARTEGILPALRLSPKDGISGDLVATGGYPLGGPQVSNRGRLVAKSTDLVDPKSSKSFVWKTTAEVLPGDSGGPMINTSGEVVGVVFALDLVEDYKLAIPVSRLQILLKSAATLTKGKPCTE